MAQSVVFERVLDASAESGQVARPAVKPRVSAGFSAVASSCIVEIAPLWRKLEEGGIDSPGQSYDFCRLWAEKTGIAIEDRVFVVGLVDDEPVALLALKRVKNLGHQVLTWFAGRHVGCNAPLVDKVRLAALGKDGRRALWRKMTAAISGADLLYLPAVPTDLTGLGDLFADLGATVEGDVLYRAQFDSWNEANTTQRSKSRRKHDRQQGDKLAALGTVDFQELTSADDLRPVLDTMFRQRAERFKVMGVSDPFTAPQIRSFYDASVDPGSGVDIRLHVLRLNGKIVATRYNVAHGNRLFCLISSMSDDPAVQVGSPGKQCLLRVMETVFDRGCRMFDMGAGFTDEKRHWCNVQVPLRQHYVPLTVKGQIGSAVHRLLQVTRGRIKTDPALLGLAKALRLKSSQIRHGGPEERSE